MSRNTVLTTAFFMALFASFALVSVADAATWVKRTTAGITSKSYLASSADGTRLVATETFRVYFSTDSGVNWTQLSPSPFDPFTGVTISSDGTKIAAFSSGNGGSLNVTDGVHFSSDSGATWAVRQGAGSHDFIGISGSTDLSFLVMGDKFGGTIYTSANSGVAWTQRAGQTGTWSGFAMSGDGTKMFATLNPGFIYTSTNSGVSWTARNTSSSRWWKSIAVSSDGTKVAAVDSFPGYVWTSIDGGVTWVQKTSSGSRTWADVAISSDGTKIAAVDGSGGYIYVSADSGTTWTQQTSAGTQNWYSIAMSTDGKKMVASGQGGYVWTNTFQYLPPTAPVITGPASGLTNTAQAFTFTATDPDAEQIRYGIDWDNNGTVDEWAPVSGLVASGVAGGSSKTWASPGTYTFQVLAQDVTGANSTWTSKTIVISNPPAPTCSVTLTPSTVDRGGSATLSWTSTNATTLYINVVGYVLPSGSTAVSPSATTNYDGTATGPGGTIVCPASLTVLTPTANLTVGGVSSQTLSVGNTASFSWSSTFGSSYSSTYFVDTTDTCGNTGGVNYAWTVGTAGGSSNLTIGACQAGHMYTYTYFVVNSAGFVSRAPAFVTVNGLPACTLTATPSTILRGQNASLSWTSTNATGGTISPGIGAVATAGTVSVAPTNTTTYTGSFTGPGGTNSCTAATLTISCASLYQCTGQTIQYVDASCTITNLATCIVPATCIPGQSVCSNSPPVFNTAATTTGHLQVLPQLVRKGLSTKIFWDVSNVTSCTVTGSNGDSWTGMSSGASGKTSSAIQSTVIYTLNCGALSGYVPPSFSESVIVFAAPTYQEK